MGAQVYQQEITARASEALNATSTASPSPARPQWVVNQTIVRSMRSPLAGTARLPLGRLAVASARTRSMMGKLLYPRDCVVHRMDLSLPPAPEREVITIHDVVAWKFPDESAPIKVAAEEARRAAAVICVSQFSAQEAVELLGITDPFVVHNGVDERFFDAMAGPSAYLSALGLRGPYVLHAGGASKRKNLAALAQAWPKIHSARPDLTLVLSGPEHEDRTRLFASLAGTALVGRVPSGSVPGLVAGASVVVVPSLYEGFGLPALEAMAARTPVVAARTSSLPEVVGDTGVLVEPTGDDIAEGVLWAATHDARIQEMVEAARARAELFTWDRSAQEHAKVWRTVLG
ncbi:Glycosyltransferase involved in cell wall bisynthesis [Sanguibacter gelidistatuariae]|uniref:Glycosyltransferase involved in cell wall bisynthesis n=1 Tax=Sanguibacter gelidistatuariae TaxID=1814289 RepID=A0A1G6QCN9_9MICO|nr:glycosyltransferase family 1 protein [Sanguibacter gelidistatuariae]SDC90139.1 Glycosyltransferase involved in cell wall bisynthesis [Sanguibacter gelidistatuariae]